MKIELCAVGSYGRDMRVLQAGGGVEMCSIHLQQKEDKE
jgi:hypothetical protein